MGRLADLIMMAVEEGNYLQGFTTYAENDLNNHLSATSSTETFSNISRSETAYAYRDLTAIGGVGLVTVLGEFKITGEPASYALVVLGGLSTQVGQAAAAGNNEINLTVYKSGTGVHQLFLDEYNNGTRYASASIYAWVVNTTYYTKMVRDPSIGSYGTATLYIYSNEARTALLGSASLTLHSNIKTYRYAYSVQSYNSGTTGTSISGTFANMKIIY
jgi:hypothetical protein